MSNFTQFAVLKSVKRILDVGLLIHPGWVEAPNLFKVIFNREITKSAAA